jgi:hypothetical protein
VPKQADIDTGQLSKDFIEDLRTLARLEPKQIEEFARIALRFVTERDLGTDDFTQAMANQGIEPESGERLMKLLALYIREISKTSLSEPLNPIDNVSIPSNTEKLDERDDIDRMFSDLYREAEFFEKKRTLIEAEHQGDYVVMLDGEIIDSDRDLEPLEERVLPKLIEMKRHALLRKVGTDPISPSDIPVSWLVDGE